MAYDVVVPKLSEIKSLYDSTKFSWQKINNNTLFLNSNVDFTYCSGVNCPTQLRNMVLVKDLEKFGGMIVDLAMTYTQIISYKQGTNHILYGTGGMNYGIFRADVESGTMVANTNPKSQFNASNGDLLFIRYVPRRQGQENRSRIKIDVIRGNTFYAGGNLVYSNLPDSDCTPLLGYGYGFSTGSGYEKMINPPNVVARNLTLIRAGHELLKESLTNNEIQTLKTLHSQAIQRGIPIDDPIIKPREPISKIGFLSTSYQNLCGTQCQNLNKNVTIQAVVGEGLTLYTGCPVTLREVNGTLKVVGIANEASAVSGFVTNNTNKVCDGNEVGLSYEGQIVSVAPLGSGAEMFLPCYDDLEDIFINTQLRLFNGKLTKDDNRGNPTLPVKILSDIIDAESYFIENGNSGIEQTKAIKVRI